MSYAHAHKPLSTRGRLMGFVPTRHSPKSTGGPINAGPSVLRPVQTGKPQRDRIVVAAFRGAHVLNLGPQRTVVAKTDKRVTVIHQPHWTVRRQLTWKGPMGTRTRDMTRGTSQPADIRAQDRSPNSPPSRLPGIPQGHSEARYESHIDRQRRIAARRRGEPLIQPTRPRREEQTCASDDRSRLIDTRSESPRSQISWDATAPRHAALLWTGRARWSMMTEARDAPRTRENVSGVSPADVRSRCTTGEYQNTGSRRTNARRSKPKRKGR